MKKVSFLGASFTFFIRLLLVSMAMRAFVALHINLWDFANPESFKDTLGPFLFGWHFDLAIVGFIYFLLYGASALFGLSQGRFKFLNWVLIFTYSLFVIIDALYARESGRHISYEVFNLFSIQGSLRGLVAQFWLAGLLLFLWTFFVSSLTSSLYVPFSGFFKRSACFLLIAVMSLIFIRGFEGIPQDPSWSFRSGGGPKGASLALNGGYGITWSLISGKRNSQEHIEVPSEVLTGKVFDEWQKRRGIQNPIGNFDGNIIMIFLEGWPGVYSERKIDGQEVLPFFDSLKKDSLHVDLMLAGGHRTTEGLFATLCSLPNPLGKSVMFSEIENKNFTCLPQLLGQKGYSSAFFQGSDQFTSGVGILTLKTGFHDSYGKREIPGYEKKEQNSWGVYDTDLYKFMLTKMDTMKEPMLIGVNTNTTHDLKLPEDVKAVFGDEDSRSTHLSVTHFADSELKVFYEALQKRKWKKDWLIVIFSDHTSFYADGIFEHYAIPFLMKMNAASGKPMNSELVQNHLVAGPFSQQDIGATLADLTGTKAPTFLGRSMLHSQDFAEGASIFHLGQSAWFEGPWTVIFNIRDFGSKRCFQWKSDMKFKSQLPCPGNGDEMYLRGLSYLKESQDLIFK